MSLICLVGIISGEMEPMVSESSDSEDGLFETVVNNSISPKHTFSDDDSLVNILSIITGQILNLMFLGKSVFGYLRRAGNA